MQLNNFLPVGSAVPSLSREKAGDPAQLNCFVPNRTLSGFADDFTPTSRPVYHIELLATAVPRSSCALKRPYHTRARRVHPRHPNMAQAQHPSRPTATDDLVRRLRSGTDPKESHALQALAEKMIEIFGNNSHPSHVLEAAALAPATTASSYQNLSRAFGNAVIHGTADGNTLEPKLLEAFVSVLRCADGGKTADVELGNVMASLQERLKKAANHADPKTQYRLILTLSSVLDALIDTKAAGLSREELHEPLLKQLGTLSEERELRLAQAACYAHQALLGIPNDEGPYRALWRNAQPVIEGVAKVAGAVPTMDPAKLFDGLTQLTDLPALVSSMIDVVKALSGLVNSLGGATEAVKLRQKQKSWYVALRFTEMLLSARAFSHLEDFVGKVPCRGEKEFLCGLYAQFERAWVAEDLEPKQQIVRLFNQILAPVGCESRHRRVHEWVKLAADTLKQPHWKNKVPPELKFRWSWKEEYTSLIPCRGPSKGPLSADLLNKAWDYCLKAQVFYADVKVREHYLENDERLLKVERLSGDRLPMEQCYINLAVVEQADHIASRSEQGGSEGKSSPFSLLARLKVEAPAQDKQVSLHSLFDARKRQDGATAPPQRILIRGQAGVGKTTLCKRIVYNYLHERVWAGMFDRLFWVPLRTLKAKLVLNPAYNLEQWLRDEYFRAGDGDKLSKALAQAVDDPAQRSRTLFILDGLDEVSRELDSETPGLLHDLLKQPHVIITSRPSGLSLVHVGRVDLELETIGFNQDQVASYVNMAARQQAAEIEAFLQGHSLLQGLVRIPIQLEALCYSWDASMNSQGAPTTMTALYRRIESKLWKKDAARLEKPHEGKPLSEDTAKRMLDSEIALQVAPELSLLRCLAFAGLRSDVIEFDQDYQNKIWEHLGRSSEGLQATEARPSSFSFAKVSFLRSSDASSSQRNRSYHFLHLTFQEFFAAQYFVEQWSSGRELDVPNLGPSSPETEPTAAEVFLRKEKYKARYDVFWRFVAGLLYEKRDDGQLCRFFHTIENEPRDLLGPTHQRLVMHCLNEVPSNKSTNFAYLRTGLEKQLSRWVLFECSFRDRSSLASEMELPEQVLEDTIREGSVNAKVKILSALRKISAKAIELVPNWLKYGVSARLQIAVLNIPQPLNGLPAAVLEAITKRLDDEKSDVRCAAVQALAKRSALPAAILEAITKRFEDGSFEVRSAAVEALAKQPALPAAVLEAITKRLDDEKSDVRRAAVQALAKRSALPAAILEAITKRLEDEDWQVRGAAVNALAKRSALPAAVLEAITKRLEDEDWYVRRAAVQALAKRSALPAAVLEAITKRFEDESFDVRSAAAEALAKRSALPAAVLEAITERFEDKNSNVRCAAVEALAKRSALPAAVLEAITERFKDKNSNVRYAAVEALAERSALPAAVLEAITERLEDEDWYVRLVAVGALAKQSALPEAVLEAITERFKDKNSNVRYAAVEALAERSALPAAVLEAITERFEDKDSDVRCAAVQALANQSALPEAVLEAITERLEYEEDWYVRLVAVEALAKQSALPAAVLEAITERFEDENSEVRLVAVEALAERSALPAAVLEAITERFEDKNSNVRCAAVEALAERSALPAAVLEAITKRLDDEKSDVRRAAAEALVNQAVFSVDILIWNAQSLYKVWLERSLDEHFSWYVDDEICIDMPEGFRTVCTDQVNRDRLQDAIRGAQKALGILEL
ncbi:hypothetical protein RB597_010302 [Gaeumannomyces tritici]